MQLNVSGDNKAWMVAESRRRDGTYRARYEMSGLFENLPRRLGLMIPLACFVCDILSRVSVVYSDPPKLLRRLLNHILISGGLLQPTLDPLQDYTG